MSKKIVSLKIDVTKIDKKRLFESEKTGAKYLDAIVFMDDEADQYGNNGMITQQVSKEERLAGTQGAILGNCKVIGVKDDSGQPAAKNQPAQAEEDEGDLPF